MEWNRAKLWRGCPDLASFLVVFCYVIYFKPHMSQTPPERKYVCTTTSIVPERGSLGMRLWSAQTHSSSLLPQITLAGWGQGTRLPQTTLAGRGQGTRLPQTIDHFSWPGARYEATPDHFSWAGARYEATPDHFSWAGYKAIPDYFSLEKQTGLFGN